MSETKPVSKLKRWLARIGVAILVIFVLVAILMVTGISAKTGDYRRPSAGC